MKLFNKSSERKSSDFNLAQKQVLSVKELMTIRGGDEHGGMIIRK